MDDSKENFFVDDSLPCFSKLQSYVIYHQLLGLVKLTCQAISLTVLHQDVKNSPTVVARVMTTDFKQWMSAGERVQVFQSQF